jgi:hypothetical protein
MYEDREQKRHSQCRDDAEKFFYRLRCDWNGDDIGTLLGICVGLFILLASALAYFISIGLLILLARALVYVWLYLRTS